MDYSTIVAMDSLPNAVPLWRDFRGYLRERFGATVHKLPVDAGFTCPNRDGTLGTGGCSYCDGRGSRLRQAGPLPSVTEQLRAGLERYRRFGATRFIPYFQTATNTWAPLDRLRDMWDEALTLPDMVGLAVGTRPECLPDEAAALLASYLPEREVWVEFGLQSAHARSLEAVNRCGAPGAFAEAARRSAAAGLKVCAHLILGLPGETVEDMRETARFVAGLPVAGVKLHLLLVLKGTPLAEQWRRGEVPLPSREAYASWVADVLELLPPDTVIQRLTADGYRDVLLAPSWANDKRAVLDAIRRELEHRGTRQGSRFIASSTGPSPPRREGPE